MDLRKRIHAALLQVERERGITFADLEKSATSLQGRLVAELDALAGGQAPPEALLLASVAASFDVAADVLRRLAGDESTSDELQACGAVGPTVRALLAAAEASARAARERPRLRVVSNRRVS